MLKTLQIIALIIIGLVLVEGAILAYWCERYSAFFAIVPVIGGYLIAISIAIFKDREALSRRLLDSFTSLLLLSKLRAAATCMISFFFLILFAYCLYQQWFIEITGLIVHNGDPVKERITINGTPESLFDPVTSLDSKFKIVLPRTAIGSEVQLTANSRNFRTTEPLSTTIVKGGSITIPVVLKSRQFHGRLTFRGEVVNQQFDLEILANGKKTHVKSTNDGKFTFRLDADIELALVTATNEEYQTQESMVVKASMAQQFDVSVILKKSLVVEVIGRDVDFKRTPLNVIAREIGRSDPPQQRKTDDTGLAYFNAIPPGIWKVSILRSNKTYSSPAFKITEVPHLFKAPLDTVDFWTIDGHTDTTTARLALKRTRMNSVPIQQFRVLKKASVSLVNLSPKEEWQKWIPQTKGLVVRDEFVVSYNPKLKIPNWTAYFIKGEKSSSSSRRFVRDPLIPKADSASTNDYRFSGYDRGTMVSIADMAIISRKASTNASLMSVICPQTPTLNRKTWLNIESHGREFAKDGIFIIAGPVFKPDNADSEKVSFITIGENNVAVPSHFFRIHLRGIDANMRVESFLVPNSQVLEKNIRQYLTSVEEIENVTGLKFFPGVSDDRRSRLIKHYPKELWNGKK